MQGTAMARTLPKENLLPSLLDRLTDDDPLNRSLDRGRDRIHALKKKVAQLKKDAGNKAPEEIHREVSGLESKIEQEQNQYLLLRASITSLREIRDCVKRDLDWLLNAQHYAPQEELEGYPEVFSSVINFGLPDLAGKTASGVDARGLEKLLKTAILRFEPRIIRRTLKVRFMADESMLEHNALTFEIEGELWSEPVPVHLHLRTQLELEDGEVMVQEF